MTPIRRDSFSTLRANMRWRVGLVLGVLVMVLMVALGTLNTQLGLKDTAQLSWVVLVVSGLSVFGLLISPRHLGGTIFFTAIVIILVFVPAFGFYHGRPMQHWAYIFPPLLVFLIRARPALVGMVLYGIYIVFTVKSIIPMIDVVRFASGYGLMVCFIYTYALLEERAATMLRYYSDHDALSNCLNRRTFNEALEQLTSTRSNGNHCTFLLIDIDHFKAINDEHGHLVGDRIITQVAAELGRELDPGTPLFRYGGEEFAIIMNDASEHNGAELAERLRRAIEEYNFQEVNLTISIGVAEWQASHANVNAVLDQADQALYAAKNAGRNRVMTASAIV
ncbi:MAG: GGDEF domain-containing protein [Arenimonas sp.]